MNSSFKWIIAVLGWMFLLSIFAVWKDADTHMGNGPISGFIRGAVVFGGIYWLYRWAKGSGDTKED